MSSYDWYFYKVQVQTVPGIVAWGTPWYTAHTYAYHWVLNAGEDRWLVDYSPTTTVGKRVVTVTLGAEAGPEGPSVGFSVSWTYEIPDVKVLDVSDYNTHKAAWEHDIQEPALMLPNILTLQSQVLW